MYGDNDNRRTAQEMLPDKVLSRLTGVVLESLAEVLAHLYSVTLTLNQDIAIVFTARLERVVTKQRHCRFPALLIEVV